MGKDSLNEDYQISAGRKVFAAIIYLPYWIFAVVYALVVGIPLGVFFKYLGSVQDWLVNIRRDVTRWKRHPKRWRKDWIDLKVQYERKRYESDPSVPLKTRQEIENEHPEAPFPLWSISTSLLMALFASPIKALFGIIEGPFIILEDFLYRWQRYILKIPPRKKYAKLLKVARKYEFGENPEHEETFKFKFYSTLLTGGIINE